MTEPSQWPFFCLVYFCVAWNSLGNPSRPKITAVCLPRPPESWGYKCEAPELSILHSFLTVTGTEMGRSLGFTQPTSLPCLKMSEGRQDSSAGKGYCHQPWQLEFNFQDPHGEKNQLLQGALWPLHECCTCSQARIKTCSCSSVVVHSPSFHEAIYIIPSSAG